jgi:hypothetical protein
MGPACRKSFEEREFRSQEGIYLKFRQMLAINPDEPTRSRLGTEQQTVIKEMNACP